MRGMTAKNFDPVRYSGRWFEVASLKRGFAGQGQEDCHCTQVFYCLKPQNRIADSTKESLHFATVSLHLHNTPNNVSLLSCYKPNLTS